MLFGCASVNFEQSVERINRDASAFTDGRLALVQRSEQRQSALRLSNELLDRPLAQREAVQLALANSAALQAMLAESWSTAARATQEARIGNPLLALSRVRIGTELEIERALSFGLMELLTLPARSAMAGLRVEQSHLQLAGDVVEMVTHVRQAWTRAVASRQRLAYAKEVVASAEAGAELARRMETAGNFSKLARARQQALHADTAMQLALAQNTATSSREQLVRLLGLTDAQASRLQLPERLPDPPASPRDAMEVDSAASSTRFDIRMARAALDTATKAQGLGLVTPIVDIDIGIRRDTRFDDDKGTSTAGHGYEISARLPIFDWGDAQRDAMNAQSLGAASRLEATVRAAGSQVRESYSAYRTAHEIARRYRDEVLPLRKTISEENLLRYNGMIIGVFELLADAREQINSVLAAISAEEQFWLADAALHSAIAGKPIRGSEGDVPKNAGTANASH